MMMERLQENILRKLIKNESYEITHRVAVKEMTKEEAYIGLMSLRDFENIEVV